MLADTISKVTLHIVVLISYRESGPENLHEVTSTGMTRKTQSIQTFYVIISNLTADAFTFLYPSIELSSSFRYDGFDIDASMSNSCVDSALRNDHTS